MKIKELNQLLEKHIDSDFIVGGGLGSVMQDSSLFHLDKSTSPSLINEVTTYQYGVFAGHKMSINPKMKIYDMRIIKIDGTEIDLEKEGIRFIDII